MLIKALSNSCYRISRTLNNSYFAHFKNFFVFLCEILFFLIIFASYFYLKQITNQNYYKMKRILTFFMLMACAIGQMKADIVLFSADVTTKDAVSFDASSTTEITSTYATITGGKMYAINQQTSAKELIKSNTNAVGFSFTNNNTFFKVELDNALQAGDVIASRGVSANGTRGLWISTAESRPNECITVVTVDATSAAWVDLNPYTISEGDGLVGATTIYLYRATGNSTYFDEFTITRVGTTATLLFPDDNYSADISKGASSFTAPTLTVDPVAAASEVTYSSSNTNVATVDASSGAITLVGAGKTTITAAIFGSATYSNASASYTLTVINPNIKTVTATWPFDTGVEGQRATISIESVFSIDAVEVADMTYAGVGNDQGVTGTKLQPISQATDNKSQYVKFILTPKKGINFRPTSISFDAMRWGTDGSNKLHYYVEAGSNSVELGNVNPNRNGKGLGWSHYEHEIENVTCTKEAPFALACYVYGLANSKQISLANIIVTGSFDGEAEDETMYNITTSVTPEGAGTVNQSPAGTSQSEGTEVTFTAQANTGYKFLNKWTVNGSEVEGETYTIESLSENTEVVAQFKKLYEISFSAGEGDKGTVNTILTPEYTESYYTTPAANYYVSKAGYTATGWTDGNNTYGFAETINLTEDITLSPVFEENPTSLDEAGDDVTVTWDFTGTPPLNIEGATGYFVAQAEVNSFTLDIPMFIDNTTGSAIEGVRGKTYNIGRSNAQINKGSKFTIPAIKGMTVVITSASNNITETTVAGQTPTSGSGSKTATYVYEGTEETVDIIFSDDGKYYTTIKVTYPEAPQPFTFTLGETGYATYYNSKSAYTIPENLTASVVEGISGNTLNLVEISEIIPAGCGVVLEGTPGYEYTLLPTTEAGNAIENLLRGSDDYATTKGDDPNATYKFYALSVKNGKVGFYWMAENGEAFRNNPNKAYLPVKQESIAISANALFFETTDGLKNIVTKEENSTMPAYNLQGQRVSDSYKGVVITNGKKVIR